MGQIAAVLNPIGTAVNFVKGVIDVIKGGDISQLGNLFIDAGTKFAAFNANAGTSNTNGSTNPTEQTDNQTAAQQTTQQNIDQQQQQRQQLDQQQQQQETYRRTLANTEQQRSDGFSGSISPSFNFGGSSTNTSTG